MQTEIGERTGMLDGFPKVAEQEKPWGRFEQYAHNFPCTVKVITVEPEGNLSLQYHYKRDELWIVLDEGIRVEIADSVLLPAPGERLFIPRGTVHRLSGVGKGPARILEVSFGFFDEEDIVRLEDIYGRVEEAQPVDGQLLGVEGSAAGV